MRRTVNVGVLVGILAVALIVFFCMSSSLSKTIAELDETYDQAKLRLTELQNEQASLKDTLVNVGSDAFIENQARTVYDYMMPDETHLKIVNVEALYGEDGVPSR